MRSLSRTAVGSLGLIALASATATASCGSDEGAPAECTTFEPSCAPAYEPTFAQVFERTLKPSCGVSGRSCHAAEGHQGGLVYEDADQAHALLLDRGVVKPGDAACSPLALRITSTDKFRRMPPAGLLPAAEQCAVQTWIANGARR